MYSLLLLLKANYLAKSAQAPQSPVTPPDKKKIWTLSVEKLVPNYEVYQHIVLDLTRKLYFS